MILDYDRIPKPEKMRQSCQATEVPSPMRDRLSTGLTTSGAPRAAGVTGAATVRRMRVAMGTWVALEAAAGSADAAQEAIRAAFVAISEVDRLMHPGREGSDLAAICTAAPGTRVEVHRRTWEVLCLARRVSEASHGVFDPCLPSSAGRLRDIEFGSDPVVVCHAPVALDLGGIAKGYAVDRAIEVLLAAGCLSGLVNAGGDLKVFGAARYPIHLKRGKEVRQTQLANMALAVSDADAGGRPSGHRGYYSRESTQPQLACRYAAVLAPDAAIADALAKCVLLCPTQASAGVLLEFGASRVIS